MTKRDKRSLGAGGERDPLKGDPCPGLWEAQVPPSEVSPDQLRAAVLPQMVGAGTWRGTGRAGLVGRWLQVVHQAGGSGQRPAAGDLSIM